MMSATLKTYLTAALASVVVTSFSTALCVAQSEHPSPYAGLEKRPIKALSDDQIDGYLSGHGMALALAAELNGLPGPKHVLELADQLELTDEQTAATRAVYSDMHDAAVELGERIVALETELDRALAGGALEEEALARQVDEIAAHQGELRFAHLRAHLRMSGILTPHQIHLYGSLRGYGAAGHHVDRHGHDPSKHMPKQDH